MNVISLQKQFIEADLMALLDTKIISAYTGLSVSWFNSKAVYGGGIPYIKIGHKRRYCKKDVLDWLELNTKKTCNTSQYDKRGGND